MVDDTESARRERAKRLRERINSLSQAKNPDAESDKRAEPESAAEFVHRKMAEQREKKERNPA